MLTGAFGNEVICALPHDIYKCSLAAMFFLFHHSEKKILPTPQVFPENKKIRLLLKRFFFSKPTKSQTFLGYLKTVSLKIETL